MVKVKNRSHNLQRFLRRMAAAVVGAFLLLPVSGCSIFPEEEKPIPAPVVQAPAPEYRTITVERKSITKDVSDKGTIVAASTQSLSYKYSGLKLKGIYVKSGDIVKAGDLLVEADVSVLESQLRDLDVAYQKAQIDYVRQKAAGADPYTLQKYSLDLDLAKYKYESMQSDIQKSKLYAPINGKVKDMDTKIKPGDSITANSMLVLLADTSQRYVEISGENSNETRLGMTVTVTIDKVKYNGEVVMTPRDAPADLQKRVARIVVKDLPDTVPLDASADVTISTEKKDNALVIPKNVITSGFGNTKTVQVLSNDGVKSMRNIVTGIESVTESEVIQGLSEGEKVIQ